MRKHILASVCLGILALSMVFILLPAMKVPTAKAQLTDNWLVASTQAVYGYGGSGTSFTSLSLTVPSGFNLTSEIGGTPPIFVSNALTITSVASGNGYYLVGLDQPITNWPEYTSAVSTPHLYKFDGSNWSPVGGNTLNNVQITGIHKYLNEFIIVGWYMSFGWSTCYGRVYTYDGSTLTEITTAVLGGDSGNIVTAVCNCGNYILFGEYNAGSSNHPSLVKWDGSTATVVYQYPGGGTYGFVGYYPRLTSIAYNGQYALFGTSVDSGVLEQFFDNGTINSLSWTGTVDSMGWNGTDFLISGNGGTKLYDGSQFTTVDSGDYNTIGWNGAFWLLGSGTKLAKCDDFSTISSNVGFSIVDICPNIMQLLVTSNPNSVTFQALGGNMRTPVSFPMSLGGEINFIVPDNFTNNAPAGMYYNFNHAIFSHDGINETIPDPVSFNLNIGSDSNVTLFYDLAPLPTPTPTATPTHGGGGVIGQENTTYTVDVTVLANKTAAHGAMVLFGQQSATTDYIGLCDFHNVQAGTYHLTVTYYDPITSQNLRYDNDVIVNKNTQLTIDLILQTPNQKNTYYFPWWLILLLIIIAMIVAYVAYRIRSRRSHPSSGRRRKR